jgi:hypothetical protein
VLFNIAILLSYCNGDFYSAFLLVAELPIFLVLMIFYFHKNSLNLDTLYKYKKLKFDKTLFIFLFIGLFFIPKKVYAGFNFFDFNLINLKSTLYKNDFFLLYLSFYKQDAVYIFFFAILIFFISFLVIIIYQINKLQLFVNKIQTKNILFLRKQNMLKQSIYKSKLKFFSKKINSSSK